MRTLSFQVKDTYPFPCSLVEASELRKIIRNLYKAGANGVVVGTTVENDYKILPELVAIRNEF